MTAATLAAVVLGWLVALSPPERAAAAPTFPEATETAAERLQRYESIAEDISAVVLEDASPRRAAALLTAVALFESGLAKDVDGPRCSEARIRRRGCDGGRAASLWQLHGFRPESRQDAAREALRRLSASLTACRGLPETERLAAYAAGHCTSRAGRLSSKLRLELAKKLERQ